MERSYREWARMFRHKVEIGTEYRGDMEAIHDHFNVAMEEWQELCEMEQLIEMRFHQGIDSLDEIDEDVKAHTAEEMADVLVTLHVMADMMGIDLAEAYRLKMEYNLHKTATKDETGKATDDAEVRKPDFTQTLGDA